MRKIYFVGYESADIVLYLARLCMHTGCETCVVDLTEDKAVLSKLVLTEETPGQEMYRNIQVFDELHSAERSKAENVFIYCGYNDSLIDADAAADVIYVSDMMPSNALRLSHSMKKEREGKRILIIRNEIASKYAAKSLAEFAGMDVKNDVVLTVPYDEEDYRCSCYLGIDKKTSLKSLSAGMRVMLTTVFAELYGERKNAEYKEMIRKA